MEALLRGRRSKVVTPLRGRQKTEEGTPPEKGRSFFFAPKSNGRRRSHLLRASLPVYRRKCTRALMKKAIAPHLGALPFQLVGETAAELLPAPLFLSFPPGTRGGTVKTESFSQNMQAVRSKTFLPPGTRQWRGQNRPFFPEYAGGAVKKSFFSGIRRRHTPKQAFYRAHTKNRMEKNASRTPPRDLCGGVPFRRRPSVGVLPLLAAPYIEEDPSVGGAACPGGLSAPVNGAWRSKKSLCVCGSGTVLAISARLYSLCAASTAFHLERGECFT